MPKYSSPPDEFGLSEAESGGDLSPVELVRVT